MRFSASNSRSQRASMLTGCRPQRPDQDTVGPMAETRPLKSPRTAPAPLSPEICCMW